MIEWLVGRLGAPVLAQAAIAAAVALALALGALAIQTHRLGAAQVDLGRAEADRDTYKQNAKDAADVSDANLAGLRQCAADATASAAKLAGAERRAEVAEARALERGRAADQLAKRLDAERKVQREQDPEYRDWGVVRAPRGVFERLRDASGSDADPRGAGALPGADARAVAGGAHR